ncbi:hypothetical protein [Promicromonospora soli]
MARTTQTTRRIDQEVVDALQAALIAGVQAAEAWNRAQRHLTETTLLTPLHDDLVEDAEKTYQRMYETRSLISQRLRAEREGKS